MTRTQSWARQVTQELLKTGLRHFVFCSGSRNASLIAEILAHSDLKHFNFFEERSAAFFALGLARSLNKPVAVLTTSGTAVAELLPAVIEAYYSDTPLILLTADRPSLYRGSGAPQCIEQKGIFSHYVESSLDWENKTTDIEWSGTKPLHVNICLDEPEPREPIPKTWTGDLSEERTVLDIGHRTELAFEALKNFFLKTKNPLVILGGLQIKDRSGVENFLAQSGLPIYAEASSGLRESEKLSRQILKSGERFLSKGAFDGVLRIGSVPQLRFWRDLENDFMTLPVLSFDSKNFSGLARPSQHFFFDLAELNEWRNGVQRPAPQSLLDRDEELYQAKLQILSFYPESELGLLHRLSRHIPESSLVFLGNSLPVREWDLGAHYRNKKFEIKSSRGANGIDGQLSTFLGLSESESQDYKSAWGIFGDITALYDLSSPWVLSQLSNLARYFVIINNRGGKIFSRISALKGIFSEEQRKRYIENEHDIKFEAWARMWNLGYERWSSIPHLGVASHPSVIEICPSEEQSEKFWEDYTELFGGQ